MFRFEAASATIREAVPPVVTEVFALVTLLGDVAFFVVLLAVLYWLEDRESTGTVIAYAFVALATTLVLKEVFALPRPPISSPAISTDPASHGFPSGHALASTVVYGGLLLARDRAQDVRFILPTVALVGLIGLSRVVIGVHYVGDVLAGFAVGVILLAGLWQIVGRRPDRACLVAAIVAVPALVLTSAGSDSVLALGGSLGGAVGFHWIDRDALPRPSGPGEGLVLAGLGIAGTGALYWLAKSIPFVPVALLMSGLLVGGVVWFPRVFRWRQATEIFGGE